MICCVPTAKGLGACQRSAIEKKRIEPTQDLKGQRMESLKKLRAALLPITGGSYCPRPDSIADRARHVRSWEVELHSPCGLGGFRRRIVLPGPCAGGRNSLVVCDSRPRHPRTLEAAAASCDSRRLPPRPQSDDRRGVFSSVWRGGSCGITAAADLFRPGRKHQCNLHSAFRGAGLGETVWRRI
jgi:hypothetical protein